MTREVKIILSHPTGNANVRAIAKALLTQDILHQFHTTIAVFPGNFWDNMAKMPYLAELNRRSFDPQLQPFTCTFPWRELVRTFQSKTGFKLTQSKGISPFGIDEVYKSMDSRLASSLMTKSNSLVSAVYAYEDGALETFIKAKQAGIKCIYDLPIAYWETARKIIEEEALRLPKWKGTLGGIKDSETKLLRKQQELELADVIIGPSQFVLDSLPAWASQTRRILSPFGSPHVSTENLDISKPQKKNQDKLRVLFVGSMGQRKGLGDLFKAIKILKNANIELVVLGSLLAPIEFYRQEFSEFTYKPGRAHAEVLALMRSCDVFCLPSLVEGRALVMQEALSQGLPLIITPNTGGEDLIYEGETGFLVPIRSPEKIAEKLQWFLDNKKELPAMSRKARALSQTYTWQGYGDKIVKELIKYLN